jgi:hypothetical protein
MKLILSIILWLFVARVFIWFGKIIFKETEL